MRVKKESKTVILLATFNCELFLSEQLDSVLAQTYGHWRLLAHDDGSDDDTALILKQYAQQYSEKIEILDDGKRFGGASKNFGHLLQHRDAEYIMFCDQDDVWLPEKIEKTKRAMEALERCYPGVPLLVHTDLKVTDETLDVIDDSFWHYSGLDPVRDSFNRLLMQNVVTGCTVMINRALARKALPIPDDAIMHDWWLALVAARFGKIGRVDEATMLYRQHSQNDTGAQRFGIKEIVRRALRYFDSEELHTQLRRNRKQAAAFLQHYKEELNADEIEMLETFSRLDELSFWRKRTALLGYGLLKQGFVRNTGLLTRL